MTVPDFFIVGAPRCGTTAWHHYLKQHPQIYMPEKKDSHHFDSGLNYKNPFLDRDVYLALFDNVKGQKRIGEASCWYLYSNKAPHKIKRFNPGARIIIMLRNPVDMIYSLHNKLLMTGDENISDFRLALEAEPRRKQELKLPDGTYPLCPWFYLEHGKYTAYVQKYQEVFGPDKVHLVIYDDLLDDIGSAYRKTLEFLEVEPDFLPPGFNKINRHEEARIQWLQRLLSRPPQPLLGLRRLLVPGGFPAGRILRRANIKRTRRKTMDPGLRKSLHKEFARDVERLSGLLGRDLTHWCADDFAERHSGAEQKEAG